MAKNIIGKLDSIAARAVASLNERERAILDKRMAVRDPVRVPDLDPLLEPGDKVLRVFDGAFRAGEVESVAGSFATVSGGVWHRRMVALMPPDADGDLAAVVSTLGNAIVLALRRRIPSVPFGCPVGAWLHRVYVPTFENTPGTMGSVTGSHHFLAVHECAMAACRGDTPREALHWLASELWWQLRSLAAPNSPPTVEFIPNEYTDELACAAVEHAQLTMHALNMEMMPRTAFANECSGDAVAQWLDAVETMAMAARAASPPEPAR